MAVKRRAPRPAAWTAAAVFAAVFTVAALLGTPRPAQALTVTAAQPEPEACEAFEDERSNEEEEEEEEEGCEGEAATEAGDGGAPPPEGCLLRSARARLASSTAQSRVRLVVNYTAYAPADAYVDYTLAGGQGTLPSPATHLRLAQKGTFTLSRRLDEAEMEKALAARRVTVFLDVPEAPRYCRPYENRRLTIRHSLHSQIVWLQSETIFGTA
jgi:hypothetical protein